MTYFITVTAMIPYPVEKQFTQQASGMHVAISRAIKEYKLYLKTRNNGKAKRVDNLMIKAKLL